jgi:hypothetical protein
MALQIRRGTTAERTARKFLEGELIYDTTLQQVYVGDSTNGIDGTAGGKSVTAFSDENARDAVAAVFATGTHTNINFSYVDDGNNIGSFSAAVNLTSTPYVGNVNVTGLVNANGFNGWLEGNVFASDSTLLVDSGNGRIPAEVVKGTFTGNVTGNVSGNVTGNVSGNLTGTVLTAAQTNITSVGTLTSLAVSGAITGSSFTGGVVTSSITTTSGDLTVTPNTNFSNGIDVTGASTFGNVTVTGVGTFNATAGSPTLLKVTDTSTSGARPIALEINGRALDLLGSGSAMEFKVNNGTTTEQLVKLEAYTQSNLIPALSPGLNFKVYNTGTSSYDLIPLSFDGDGVLVSGNFVLNDSLILSTATAPTSSKGASGDAAGTVIITNSYIYRCIADYTTGAADIWVRVAFTGGTW